MGPTGQQTQVDECPNCEEDTVVFPQLDAQSCDHCGHRF